QWLRFGPADIIEPRHAQGADLQHVPEPLGGDESDPRALALEDGVGGDGGAVANFFDSRTGQAGLRKYFRKPIDDRPRLVLDARRPLLWMDAAVGADEHDVGEGAADVDARAKGRRHHADFAPEAATGSCRCTLGTSRQPRRTRIAERRSEVAA